MTRFEDMPFEIRIDIFKTAARKAFRTLYIPRFERIFRNSRSKWEHEKAHGNEYTTLTEGLFHILHIVYQHGTIHNGRRPVSAVSTLVTVTRKDPEQKVCEVYAGKCCEGW